MELDIVKHVVNSDGSFQGRYFIDRSVSTVRLSIEGGQEVED